MTTLFITAENVKETTSISGTTDNDTIQQKIYYAQITDMVRVLGQSLYDKIYADFPTLTGDYEIIYKKYLIDMHAFFAAHHFILVNEVKVSNTGNNILAGNWQPTQKTVQLSEYYKNLAISVENNFRTFMEDSTIPEWGYDKKSEDATNFNDFY